MLWRGLVEVCPEDPADFPDDMSGAFVLVAAHAASREAFIELVKNECRAQRLCFMAIDDVADDTTDEDLEECMLDEIRTGTTSVVMGTFHVYPADA